MKPVDTVNTGDQSPPLSWLDRMTLGRAFVGLALFCMTIFAIVWTTHDGPHELDLELAKAMLEIGVVSVAATVLKVLVDSRDRAIARRDNQEKEINDLLARFTVSYNTVKRARRDMRALGRRYVESGVAIVVAAYDKCLADINAAQLELEAMISQIENASGLFEGDAPLDALNSMEKYLGKLVGEYEGNRPAYLSEEAEAAGTTSFIETELPGLWNLLGQSKAKKEKGWENDFHKDFVDPHKRAVEAMRAKLRDLAGN